MKMVKQTHRSTQKPDAKMKKYNHSGKVSKGIAQHHTHSSVSKKSK